MYIRVFTDNRTKSAPHHARSGPRPLFNGPLHQTRTAPCTIWIKRVYPDLVPFPGPSRADRTAYAFQRDERFFADFDRELTLLENHHHITVSKSVQESISGISQNNCGQ